MEEGYLEELDSNHQEIKALGNGYYDSLSKTSEQLNEDSNNTEIQESKGHEDLKNSGNNENNNNNNNVNVNPLNNESKENGYIYGLKSSLHLESHKTTKDGIDWTAEFLDLMIKLEKYSELNLELTYQQLARLANNFLDVAKSYGKIIINEASLPDSQKTIKPIKVGGLAGGPKYRVQNILFKLAIDWMGYYGGHEFVKKAAGHDLKGLMAIYQCQNSKLVVPFMCLVDYKGYRLIAISSLPISGENSLVYGSANGGVSVHADEPEICEIMAQVGSQLNLKEHTVGITESTKNLYTPVDLEVHKIKDGRYAVCDFARLFPPEYPESKKKGAFLYKMLRPELVKTNRISLSSDGISKFGHHERENDEEIKEATRNLIDFRIPNFAYSFSRKFKHSNIQPMSLLVHELHRAGINCRYLGLVRSWSHFIYPRESILNECVARVIKNLMEKRMRSLNQASQRLALETTFKTALVQILNIIFEKRGLKHGDRFWKKDLKIHLESAFTGGLTVEEKKDEFDLRDSLSSSSRLLERIISLTGIVFEPSILTEFQSSGFHYGFEFLEVDISKLPEKTKHMNIVDHAEAQSLYLLSKKKEGSLKKRLFNLAMNRFEAAVTAIPDDSLTLTAWGDALYTNFKETSIPADKNEAIEKYFLAKNINKLYKIADDEIYNSLSRTHFEQARLFYQSAACIYRRAIETEVRVHESCLRLANLYISQTRRFPQFDGFHLAGEQIRKIIELKPELFPSELVQYATSLSDVDLANLAEILNKNPIENNEVKLKLFDWRFGFRMTTGSIIKLINISTCITQLILRNLVNLMDEEFSLMIQNCPKLEILDLRNCTLITDNSISELCKYCTNLIYLDLRGCSQISNSSLEQLSIILTTKLQSLYLECKRITDDAIENCVKQSYKLKELVLNRCTKLTSRSLLALSKYCKDLEFLKIKWFVNFSAPGFLVEIPKLKHLSLNYVFHLSERQLLEVVNQCTNIEVLNVTNSNLLIPYKLLEEKLYNRKINFINRAFNDKKYRQNLTFVQKTLQCPKGMNYKNCYLVINYMALSPICTHIEFVDCDLTRNAPIIALGLQACKCLVYLRFDNVELGEQGSSSITNALAQNKYLKLEHLVMLKSFPFSLENLNQLIQAFQGKELELVNMELEGELAGMQLGSFLQKSKDLVLLNLSQNPGLGNLGVKELLSGWFHTSIQLRDVIESIFTLDLSNCGIGVEGAKAISALLEVNPDLGVLKLNANNLGDEGLTELSKGIAKNHQLIHLGLQENKITDVGLIKLAQALNVQEKKRIVSNIKILDLSKNQIQQNGVLELSEALNDGSLIQELHLSGNPLLAGAIKSLTIILPTSEIEKLFLSFEEEEINTLGIEKELVDLMVESLINHRVINLGPVTSRILSLAKVNLPIRRREISKTQPSNLNLVPHKLNRQDSQKKLNNPTLFVDDNNRKSAVANFLFRKNVENL